MKVKKSVSALAAFVMAAAGVSVASVTANTAVADGMPPIITINSAQMGHLYSAYRIAELSNPVADKGDSTKIAHVDISTVGDEVGAITNAAEKANGNEAIPSEYSKNPAAYLATLEPAQVRIFADNFKPAGKAVQALSPVLGDKVMFTGLSKEGLYFVTDTVVGQLAETGSQPKQAGPSAVVPSTMDNFKSIELTKDDKQKDVAELGQYFAKSDPLEVPGKTVDAQGVVGIGSKLHYTLTGDVPDDITSFPTYTFKFIDTPGKGLTVDLSTISVKVGDSDLKKDTDYTVSPADTLDGDGHAFFTVDLSTWVNIDKAAAAGKTVTVRYTGTVNQQAEKTVSNSVKLDNDTIIMENPGIVDVTLGGLKFTKVGIDKDAEGLGGAKFTISKDGAEQNPLHFIPGETDSGQYALAQDQQAGTTEVTSAAKGGVVNVQGLPQGTYKVTETDAPDGYLDTIKAEFTLTIDKDGKETFDKDILGLVSVDANGAITVRNIKSLTQLPLTGGVGITMFVLLGAIVLGGAGFGLVHVRRKAAATVQAEHQAHEV